MSETKRELARCSGFDVGIEDHGMFYMFGAFEGDGWVQGLGLAIDEDFIVGILRVFLAGRIQQINGRCCWVTHTHDDITKVEPLFPAEGEAFDVEQWRREARERDDAVRPIRKRQREERRAKR